MLGVEAGAGVVVSDVIINGMIIIVKTLVSKQIILPFALIILSG